MDIGQLREPIEVWRAAIGNTAPLAERLRAKETIFEFEREALALLISGELKPPRRKKKIDLSEMSLTVQLNSPRLRKENAAVLYRHIMGELRKKGQERGRSAEVFEYVAQYDGLEVQQVIDEVRRAKRAPVENKGNQARDLRSYCLSCFKQWCHLNWDEVQQFRRRKS